MKILKDYITNYSLEELLEGASEERREKAHKMRDERAKKSHLLGEGLLRRALKDSGHKESKEIKLLPSGKPYVEVENFHFNISHSNELVVLAFGAEPVGIDVEFMKNREISFYKRYFHPRERDFLELHDKNVEIFYRIWTLKESYMKAIGIGINDEEWCNFYCIPTDKIESSVKACFTQEILDNYVISTARLVE